VTVTGRSTVDDFLSRSAKSTSAISFNHPLLEPINEIKATGM